MEHSVIVSYFLGKTGVKADSTKTGTAFSRAQSSADV